jgi:glycosyltransferase involved in cell wall biosynthesis
VKHDPEFLQAPAISVLMPVRNAESTVEAAVQSISSQTFPHIEIVIIDDGSTDATPSILIKLASKDPRIHLHKTMPKGIAHALNFGIKKCRAPWIARMDADDLMTKDRLELQLSHTEANPHLGVISGLITHGGEPGGFAMYVDWLNSVTTPGDIERKRFIESPIAHPSVMFRRDLIDRYGGYREGDFPEDYELWLRWLGAGVKFGKVPHPVLIWNDDPSRLTRSDPRYTTEKFYQTKLSHLATWLRKNVDPGREIWLWGAGRVTRKRFSTLSTHGIQIAGYIDIDPKKCGPRRDGLKVVLPADIPSLDQSFIVSGVAKHGARELIQKELQARGWHEGHDYIHAA